MTVNVGQDARFATITVEDTGDGIPPDAAERIFDRGASRTDGTGIGLHLARALARSDGGSLRLTQASPPRFELRLRRAGQRGALSEGYRQDPFPARASGVASMAWTQPRTSPSS